MSESDSRTTMEGDIGAAVDGWAARRPGPSVRGDVIGASTRSARARPGVEVWQDVSGVQWEFGRERRQPWPSDCICRKDIPDKFKITKQFACPAGDVSRSINASPKFGTERVHSMA